MPYLTQTFSIFYSTTYREAHIYDITEIYSGKLYKDKQKDRIKFHMIDCADSIKVEMVWSNSVKLSEFLEMLL